MSAWAAFDRVDLETGDRISMSVLRRSVVVKSFGIRGRVDGETTKRCDGC